MSEEKRVLFQHVGHPHKPRNVAQAHKQALQEGGFNTQIAVGMTRVLSSMLTFWIVGLIITVWIIFNLTPAAFDRMPFPLLLTILNIPQISMMIGLGVGQGVLSKHSEMQSEEMFNTTQRSFYELGEIAQHLSSQDTELLKQTAELLKQTPLLEEIRAQLLQAQQAEPPKRKRPTVVKATEAVDDAIAEKS